MDTFTMKKLTSLVVLAVVLFAQAVGAQVPVGTQVAILKAEDARNFSALKPWLESKDAGTLARAALAAGRIGDAAAVPVLVRLLNDRSEKVREMAAFALGEIESIDAADAIRIALGETARAQLPGAEKANLRGRLVEAAGKIVAAMPPPETGAVASVPDHRRLLGEAIVFTLERELQRKDVPNKETIRLGLTAVLRARPEGGELTARKLLAFTDPDIVADALNTLSRLRAKGSNEKARELLGKHADPMVRANSARLLGAVEDKDAVDLLIKAATGDADSRVRVSAIRSLATLQNEKAEKPLLGRGRELLLAFKPPTALNPVEKNELLEIASALGRILEFTENKNAVTFLSDLRRADRFRSAETEIALASVAPMYYFENEIVGITELRRAEPKSAVAIFQGYGHVARLEKEEYRKIVQSTGAILLKFAEGWFWEEEAKKYAGQRKLPIPEMLKAFAAGSTRVSGILKPMLDREKDVFIRATLAELLSQQPKSKENIETLIVGFAKALETDSKENDAQLAFLDALFKLDKRESVGSLLRALNAADFVVRKKAFQLLQDQELQKEFPEITDALELSQKNRMDEVLPFDSEVSQAMNRSNTKLGQVLNTDADYRRAAMRKNGRVKAVFTTAKGSFTIDLLPEDAPLTVDNFSKLANAKYFDGLEVHRVVANFVMQDGDPVGNGSGGPGWSIRCEVNMVPYGRGAVGMALSGKDTGGSQWFVTHSPQPHLDGGYTVFGQVNETGMKVVDNIVRGDKLISVRIVGR